MDGKSERGSFSKRGRVMDVLNARGMCFSRVFGWYEENEEKLVRRDGSVDHAKT